MAVSTMCSKARQVALHVGQQLIRFQVSNKQQEPVIAAAALAADGQRRWVDKMPVDDCPLPRSASASGSVTALAISVLALAAHVAPWIEGELWLTSFTPVGIPYELTGFEAWPGWITACFNGVILVSAVVSVFGLVRCDCATLGRLQAGLATTAVVTLSVVAIADAASPTAPAESSCGIRWGLIVALGANLGLVVCCGGLLGRVKAWMMQPN